MLAGVAPYRAGRHWPRNRAPPGRKPRSRPIRVTVARPTRTTRGAITRQSWWADQRQSRSLLAGNRSILIGPIASATASTIFLLSSFHGVLAGQLDGTREPGLILTPPDKATEEDDGYLSASEIANLKLDADWVILSACNTAAGAATSAEALSGLARAFIYAQARALLVSHWEVYLDATVKLITTAIREMARDAKVGRAEALRRSMLALIDKGEPHEEHPAYWAPFVVVGEGGTDAALTRAATTVPNMKKVPTAARNQKPAPRPQDDWRVEILR